MIRYIVGVVLFGFVGVVTSSAFEIKHLRLEYLVDPTGITEVQPRFSWEIVSAERGFVQTGYRILVSSQRAGKGDLWDSQLVASSETAQVVYGGQPLQSGQQCFWEVRVVDGAGVEKRSATATFSMGLLHETDWQGKWIGLGLKAAAKGTFPKEAQQIVMGDSAGVVRKHFNLDEAPTDAQLMALLPPTSSLWINHRHVMTTDGSKVGQSLAVGGYLVEGHNVIAIYLPAKAPLLFALDIEGRLIVSDSDWKEHGAVPDLWQSVDLDDANWKTTKTTQAKETEWQSIDRVLPARMLRKSFSVEKPVKRAVLYLVGLGLHEAWMNGQRLSDEVLVPGLADYSYQLPSVARDVTDVLREGSNVVGVHLGNGRFYAPRTNVPAPAVNYGAPIMRAQLVIEHVDGAPTVLVSDESWSATDQGPIRANNDYDGEVYDARMEMPGWSEPAFVASGWKPAELLEAPKGKSIPLTCEPIRVTGTLKMESITELKPGVWICDFGQNITGWVQLKVKGPSGTRVKMRFAQRLAPEGGLYVANLRSALATDVYVLKGSEQEEVWEPRFTYHGFRYVEVTGYPGELTLDKLEARIVGTDMRQVGEFKCSNPMLNQIIENSRWTIQSTCVSVPMDCADRDERQGWQGDRAAECHSEMALFDVAAIYGKWLTDIRYSQKEDGAVSDVSPAYWEFYSKSAVWPSVQTLSAQMLYEKYGDRRILEKHYAGSKAWVAYQTNRKEDGLLPADSYGDWCAPSDVRELIQAKDPGLRTNKRFMSNAYYANQLLVMKWWAEQLGKAKDAAEFQREYETTRQTIQNAFWKDGQFVNGTQTSYILALAFDLVPEDKRTAFAQAFVDRILQIDGGKITTGNIGIQWIHGILDSIGESDLALQIATQTEYPGLGYMIDQGATSIWELWNGDTAEPTMNSTNHIMMIGDVLTWCFERLAGIQTVDDAPGYARINLEPTILKNLDHVSAKLHTIRGPVSSTWRQEGNRFYWDVTIPANTQARVVFPKQKNSSQILESGKIIDFSKGKWIEGQFVLAIGSGSYKYQVEMD